MSCDLCSQSAHSSIEVTASLDRSEGDGIPSQHTAFALAAEPRRFVLSAALR